MRDVFVEDGRVEHVDRLEEAFRAMATADAPATSLISLESRSGYGKTRVVQEFYRRIAREQSYWPESLVDESGGAQQARKRISFRELDKPEGAPLTFMWLGVDCEVKDGARESRLATISQTLRNHIPSAFMSGPTVGDGVEEGIGIVVDKGIEAAGVSAFPGVGAVMFIVRAVGSFFARKRVEKGERAPRNIDIDTGAARSVLDDLRRVHRRRRDLPFVLVIEDAHDADRPVIELIRELLIGADTRSRPPVLVVTMAWPERLAEQEDGGGEDSFGGLVRELQDADAPVDRRALAPLPGEGMKRIFRQAAPATTDPVMSALVDTCDGNPFMARLLLELDDVRGAIRNGAITLDVGLEIPRLPTTLSDAMRELWRQLPNDVRLVLAVSALQGREFVAGVTEDVAPYLPVPPQQPHLALGEAVTRHDWVRRLDEDVLVFFEHYNYELALDAARGALWGARVTSAIAQRVAELRHDAGQWGELTVPAQELLLALHVRTMGASDPRSAAESARELFDRKRGIDTETALHWAREALDLMRAGEAASAVGGSAALPSTEFLGSMSVFAISHPSLMRGLAEAQVLHREALEEGESSAAVDVLKMAGRLDDAVEMARRLVALPQATAADELQLLDALAKAGRTEESRAMAETLAARPPTAEDRVEAELTSVLALLGAGMFGEASDNTAMSSDDPTIRVMGLLAAGRGEDAVALARQTLADAKDPAQRQSARATLAIALESRDRGDELIELHRAQLAEARSRDERQEARDELASQLELAATSLRIEDFFSPPSDAEQELWDEVLALRRHTLAEAESRDEERQAKDALASALGLADHDDEACELRQQLLAEARLPDEVAKARTALRHALSSAGRWDEAVPLLLAEIEAASSPEEKAACENDLAYAKARAGNASSRLGPRG
jgi:hypothetical protein